MMTTEVHDLLEYTRRCGGTLSVPRLVAGAPAIRHLVEAGIIAVDETHCTDDVVAFCVVSLRRVSGLAAQPAAGHQHRLMDVG
ncbi:MAG: hypothetical protein U1E62_07940 [Alsobacter sp.]